MAEKGSTVHPMRHFARHPLRQLSQTESIIAVPLWALISFGWILAAIANLTSSSWWNGESVRIWMSAHHDSALPLVRPLMGPALDNLTIPIAVVVASTQLGIGIGLISGKRVRLALIGSALLSGLYLTAGAVSPSIFILAITASFILTLRLGVVGDGPVRPHRIVLLMFMLMATITVPFIETANPLGWLHDPAFLLASMGLIGAVSELTLLAIWGQVTVPPALTSVAPYVKLETLIDIGTTGSTARHNRVAITDETQPSSHSPLPAARHPWQPDSWQNPDECTVDHHWAMANEAIAAAANHPYGDLPPVSTYQAAPLPGSNSLRPIDQLVNRRFQADDEYWRAPECRSHTPISTTTTPNPYTGQ